MVSLPPLPTKLHMLHILSIYYWAIPSHKLTFVSSFHFFPVFLVKTSSGWQ